ncbi:MAG: NADPH:quinone oxidoreductase family protein [Alphaproteobacteria bacterium]
MKAVLCKQFGPPESLVLEAVASPTPGPGEVRLRVHAAGVNFPDTLIIEGKYQYKPEFPFSPGGEVAGEVLEVGAEVTDVAPGDRVMAGMTYGAFAEEVVAGAERVMRIPDELDFLTAASMSLTYGTAAHALIERGRLQAGETLLVHGAAGGVGLSMVEVGKAMGARVIATAGTEEKLRAAKSHGADEVINYVENEFRDAVKDLTDGKGADVICDPVGGDVFDQSLRCINWGGRLLVIGFASGRIASAPANLVLLKGCSLVGVFWGSYIERDPEGNAANFERIFQWWREGAIKPHISHTFPLAQASDALYALLERKVIGKAVLKIVD